MQALLALQPRRLAGMGEAELLYALVDLLPPEQAARLMQHMALLGSLPPVRKQLARPVLPYVRALPHSPGGLFGPTPLDGKPQLRHASAVAARAEVAMAVAVATVAATRVTATTEATMVAEARGGAVKAVAVAAAARAAVTTAAERTPRQGRNPR